MKSGKLPADMRGSVPVTEKISAETTPNKPLVAQTPFSALGPMVHEKVTMESRNFIISRPDESDHLLDHPAIKATFEAEDYLPYWTELWPAARMLAKAVLRENWTEGLEALELGCGLGLPGIAALARGLRVIFSDCDLTALELSANNARLNGFKDFRLQQLDWRFPPRDLRVPVILASDVVYELRHINPLVALIKNVLLPGGLCLLTDADRLPSYNLREALEGEGFRYTTQAMKAGDSTGKRVKGTLYRIHVTK